MSTIAPTRRAASLKVGEVMPAFEKHFSTIDLVAYGAATWDWHRLHYDVDYARSVNLPGVIVDGQAFGAVLARHALDWLGPRAFVAKLSFKMRAMAFAGDTLRAEGEVTAIRAEGDHDVVVLAQRLKLGDRTASEALTEVRLPR
jgi:acyl dehydratase